MAPREEHNCDLDELTRDPKLPADAADKVAVHAADNINSGLDKQMTFTRAGDGPSPGKLTFTETSSKTLSHRGKHGCRDEITDRFRKLYRYQSDNESARDVTLECIEYMLTTRGGRPCN